MSMKLHPLRAVVLPLNEGTVRTLELITKLRECYRETYPDTTDEDFEEISLTDLIETAGNYDCMFSLPRTGDDCTVYILKEEDDPPEGFSPGDVILVIDPDDVYERKPAPLGRYLQECGFDIEEKNWARWG